MKLIFLGCGYLGYNLSEILSETYDTRVVGLDSPYTKLSKRFSYLDAFSGDLDDNFEDAIVFDSISLIANNATAENEDEKLEQIKQLYSKLFEKCKERNIKKYYFLSSGGTIYGDSDEAIDENHHIHPKTLYAKSKAMLEELLQNSGLDYVIIRLSNPYGGYQVTDKKQGVIPIYIEKALKNDTFSLWGTPNTIRDYIYIDDLANAVDLCIINNVSNQVINVGSGIGHSLQEIFDYVKQVIQKEPKVEVIPSDVEIVKSIVLDTTKLKKLTGFEIKTALEDGINKEIERIQEEIK